MSLGNAYPRRSTYPDVTDVEGKFVGGGAAADCTKDTTTKTKGLVSLAYNAATGKYKLTFLDVGIALLCPEVIVTRAAGAVPMFANVVESTFSTTAKTVEVEFWAEAAGSLALTDLATTDNIHVRCGFIKNKVV